MLVEGNGSIHGGCHAGIGAKRMDDPTDLQIDGGYHRLNCRKTCQALATIFINFSQTEPRLHYLIKRRVQVIRETTSV